MFVSQLKDKKTSKCQIIQKLTKIIAKLTNIRNFTLLTLPREFWWLTQNGCCVFVCALSLVCFWCNRCLGWLMCNNGFGWIGCIDFFEFALDCRLFSIRTFIIEIKNDRLFFFKIVSLKIFFQCIEICRIFLFPE